MKAVILVLGIMLFGTVNAQEYFQEDVNAMFSISYAFDQGRNTGTDNGLKLGFSINHTRQSMDNLGKVDLFNRGMVNHKLVDIEVSSETRYFSRFNILGQDALTYTTVMNADGEARRYPFGLSWEQMVGFGILGGAVIYWVVDSNSGD